MAVRLKGENCVLGKGIQLKSGSSLKYRRLHCLEILVPYTSSWGYGGIGGSIPFLSKAFRGLSTKSHDCPEMLGNIAEPSH